MQVKTFFAITYTELFKNKETLFKNTETLFRNKETLFKLTRQYLELKFFHNKKQKMKLIIFYTYI